MNTLPSFERNEMAETVGSSLKFNTYLKHDNVPFVIGHPDLECKEEDGVIFKIWNFTERSTGAVVSLYCWKQPEDNPSSKHRYGIGGFAPIPALRFKKELEQAFFLRELSECPVEVEECLHAIIGGDLNHDCSFNQQAKIEAIKRESEKNLE